MDHKKADSFKLAAYTLALGLLSTPVNASEIPLDTEKKFREYVVGRKVISPEDTRMKYAPDGNWLIQTLGRISREATWRFNEAGQLCRTLDKLDPRGVRVGGFKDKCRSVIYDSENNTFWFEGRPDRKHQIK